MNFDETLVEEKQDLINAINTNNEKLNELFANLEGVKAVRTKYSNAFEKCKKLKKKIKKINIAEAIVLGALGVTLAICVSLKAGIIVGVVLGTSIVASNIVYMIKTRKERKFIKSQNPTKLQVEQCKIENDITRRQNRGSSLQTELRKVNTILKNETKTHNETPVVGEERTLSREMETKQN